MTYNPVKWKHNWFKEIAEAEADIAKCMADFICCVLDELKTERKLSVEEKIELFKRLILASAVKEKAIADVIKALSKVNKPKKAIGDNVVDRSEDD